MPKLAAILICLILAMPALALDASQILVVSNRKSDGSERIAEHYMAARGIAKARHLVLVADINEEISREQFNSTILEPIRKTVREDAGILGIVLTRGVPLKVKASNGDAALTQRDWASVDSELTLALKDEYALPGWVTNSHFQAEAALTRDAGLLIVHRLDGPTVEDALALIDRAIVAEALGPEGKSFLDTRGMKAADGYGERDTHMRTVADAWKVAGIEFEHDDTGPVIDLSTRGAVLHYYGWYAGNPKGWKGAPKFRTGAIGVHLHSFAASTVRNTKGNWVAPLVSWGVTATWGTAYEPFTVGFPYEGVFWDRIGKGFNFGQAGMMANQLLSWQAVFVGDPLYRPYGPDVRKSQLAARERVFAQLAKRDGDPLVGVEAAALAVIERWVKEADAAGSSNEAALLEAWGGLISRLHSFGGEAALAAKLPAVDRAAKRRWNEIKSALRRNPEETTDYDRALEQWRGLTIHSDLVEYQADLAKAQERDAAKLLKTAEQAATRDSGILKAWQAAVSAARLTRAESASKAEALRQQLERDKAELLTAQADSALERPLQILQAAAKKGLSERDRTNAEELIRTHPDCPNRKAIAALLAGE